MQPNGYQPAASPWSDYADLDGDGAAFLPQHAFRSDTKTLASGDYDCEILDAKLERNPNGKPLVRVGFQILNGRECEHTYWLSDVRGKNAFGAEMKSLGFPADSWGAGPGKVPLSQAIPDCVAKLVGLRFRANKSVRTGQPPAPNQPAPVYHDWLITCRLGAAVPGAAVTPQAVVVAPTQAARMPAVLPEDDEIPF